VARIRQLIALAALLAAASFFPTLARAATYEGCYSTAASWNGAECADEGSAWQGATAYANAYVSGFNADPSNIKNKYSVSISTSYTVPNSPSTGYTAVRVRVVRETGTNALTAERRFLTANTCSKRQPLTSTFSPKSGSTSCSDGCIQYWYRNADGTSTGSFPSVAGATCSTSDYSSKCPSNSYWNGVLNVCEPKQEECEGGKKPNANGQCAPEPCPEGMTQQQDGTCKAKESECPSGQVKGPDGSCVPKPNTCGTGQAQGADGTCKPDKDGDGKPDDEDTDDDGEDDTKSFSGGDSCASPPSCSGDPIMCGQARIQWRIDCNTRKNRNISGGGCSAVPICTGEKCDAMEYSSMLFQWRTACATEKLLAKGNGNTDNSQPEWTKVGGMSQDPGAGANASDTKVLTVNQLSTDDLDQSGFGGGVGQCPGFASGSGGGQLAQGFLSVMASPPAIFCDWVKYMAAICITGAAIVSSFILARGGA
jgi:hypothetical protein